MTAADRAGTTADESYGYDSGGNRNTSGYTTGTANRVTASPGYTYTYDAEGNLASKTQLNGAGTTDDVVTTYAYDYRNRLTGVTVRNGSGAVTGQATYTYDALNRRIGTNVDTDGAGGGSPVQTWTIYDGQNSYADFDGSGSVKTRYLQGPAVDWLLARTDASTGASAWYLTDRLGTVRDIATTSGAVIDHIAYDSYGRVTNETNPANGDRFKFTGRELDPVSGLQYHRARYYDAALGRWTQEDPIGFATGDANLYRYVGNGPTDGTDPSGLQSWTTWVRNQYDQAAAFTHELVINQAGSAASAIITTSTRVVNDYAGGIAALATTPEAWRAASGALVQEAKDIKQGYWDTTAAIGNRITAKAELRGVNVSDASSAKLFQYGLEDFIGGKAVEAWHGFDSTTGKAIEGDVFGGGERTQRLLFGASDFLGAAGIGLSAVSSVTGLTFTLGRAATKEALVLSIEELAAREAAALTIEEAECQLAGVLAERGGGNPQAFHDMIAESLDRARLLEKPAVGVPTPNSKLLSSQLEGRAKELADPKLIATLEKRGYQFFDDAETQRLLDYFKANASTDLAGNISLRPDARHVEVLEEYLHNVMNKKGMYEGLSTAGQEILTKEWMVRHRTLLNIAEEDASWLQQSANTYKK